MGPILKALFGGLRRGGKKGPTGKVTVTRRKTPDLGPKKMTRRQKMRRAWIERGESRKQEQVNRQLEEARRIRAQQPQGTEKEIQKRQRYHDALERAKSEDSKEAWEEYDRAATDMRKADPDGTVARLFTVFTE